MPKKRKFKIKDIIARDINGLVTNYGPLMIGYVNGIPCLAHREVLLLLGIKLGNHKPPQVFYNRLQLRIPVAGCYVTVFAVNGAQVLSLGMQLSKRDWSVKAYLGPSTQQDPVTVWEHGEVVENRDLDITLMAATKQPDPFAYHGRGVTQLVGKERPWRTSRWHKFKLLVNRLFSKAA